MDAVKIIIVFLIALGIPFALAGLWWWLVFWVCVGSLLGIYELISKLVTGKTISQKFWVWKETAPAWKKWSIGVGMVIFWAYLLCHLYLGW